jgi:hypothetical protein
MVVIGACPHLPGSVARQVACACGGAFQPGDCAWQGVIRPELQQPVDMVWHQGPCQHPRTLQDAWVGAAWRNRECDRIDKQLGAILCASSDVVDAAGDRNTMPPEALMAGVHEAPNG